MEKYLLFFCVFLVTWQIKPTVSFSDHFKNYQMWDQDIGNIADVLGRVPPSPPNCNDLNSNDTVLDILKHCDILKSVDKNLTLKIDFPMINVEGFSNFTHNLKSIDGVSLEMRFTNNMKYIDIPNLHNFMNCKLLSISSIVTLQYVDIRVEEPLSNFGKLAVYGNGALVSFLLIPEGGEICGDILFVLNDQLAVIYLNVTKIDAQTSSDITISGNPLLESIYLQYLEKINNVKMFQIVKNMLNQIVVPKLTTITGMDRFEISENRNLVNLTIPELKILHANEIIISKNSHLERIEIGNFNNPLELGQNVTLIISQNPKLKKVVHPLETLLKMNIIIRGNPNLEKEWLIMLRNKTNISHKIIEVQMDGECRFDEEIKDLSELNGCKNVVGGLKLANDVTGKWEASIETIFGDIHMGNNLWWEFNLERKNIKINGILTSLRCDGPPTDQVKILANCTTKPPSIEENIATEMAVTEQPVTFGPEDFVFEGLVEEESATTPQSSWLSETDKTAIILIILGIVFFAVATYLRIYLVDLEQPALTASNIQKDYGKYLIAASTVNSALMNDSNSATGYSNISNPGKSTTDISGNSTAGKSAPSKPTGKSTIGISTTGKSTKPPTEAIHRDAHKTQPEIDTKRT